MTHEAPNWLTAELLWEITGKEVTNFNVSPAAPPGSNYGSVVTRVRVALKGQAELMSFIVKSELPEGTMKESFDLPETTEHDFYYKFIPEAGKIADTCFAPRAFPTARSNSVILEDLSCLGFKMASRSKQLDFEHCRLYMMAAAKMHAASFAVHKNNPALVESIGKEKWFSHELRSRSSTDSWKKKLEGGFALFLKATNELDKCGRAHRVITDVQEHLWNMIVDAHKKSKNINTINQGDPWTTNMMFRYDEYGVVQEIRLLDFQCLRFASPVTDIVWFIWCSANHEVKTHGLPDLYKIYLGTFNENLAGFGYSETFSEEDFMESIKKLSPMVLFIVVSIIPVILSAIPMDADKMNKDIIEFYSQYYDKYYSSCEVPKYVEEMEKAGVFDFLEQHLNQL